MVVSRLVGLPLPPRGIREKLCVNMGGDSTPGCPVVTLETNALAYTFENNANVELPAIAEVHPFLSSPF